MTSNFTIKQSSLPRSQGWGVPSLLQPLRSALDHLPVRDRGWAHLLCRLIPAQCPFERTIRIWGRCLFHIPPLCKLNPFYDQVVGLRFRALTYLAEEYHEDISAYIR